ncbi:MAG: DEAD/DEAH box helicase [Candidatus Sumerlaeaceae bacterium]
MNSEIKPQAADATFAQFDLSPQVMRGVEEAGFTTPSPIQLRAIPVIMAGRDMIGQAHTGTGKTAAFGLPALHMLRNTGKVEVLVVTPTRELCNQVSEEIYRLGKFRSVRTVPIYGGQPYARQIESVRRGGQIVVATPGRLLDLLEGGRLKDQFQPWLVVLDEADEMLDMGFFEDVQKIFDYLPEERQTLLFSATVPKPIQDLAAKILKSPEVIRVDQSQPTSSDIEQHYYVIDEHERDDATVRLIDSLEPGKAIIFCRTKSEVDRLSTSLAARGQLAKGLHGDMDQPVRERVIGEFRTGDFTTLVATDVAARGLDVADVTHVFNYHIPFDTESYVHRIGRTGRAGKKGVAVTLVTPHEYHGLRRIQGKVGRMQQRFIPSHTELKKASERKLLDAIRGQHADGNAERLLDALEKEFGLPETAHRLLAMLMQQSEVRGPDRIGVQGTRLERLQNPPAKTGKPGFKGKGPFKGKPGGFGGKPGGFKKDRFGGKPGGFKKAGPAKPKKSRG